MDPVEEPLLGLDCKTPAVKASTHCDKLMDRIVHTTDLENGSGDVMIVVKHHKKSKTLRGLLVSSQAMARASSVWKRMFTGMWAETRGDSPLVLDYTEDNSTAVVIIMNIIHLRFNDVPLTVSLSELRAIATFTDKFMTTCLVLPWIEGWLRCLSESVDKVGCEAQWLKISWEFGLVNVFDRIIHRLAFGAPLLVTDLFPPSLTISPGGIFGATVAFPTSEDYESQDIFYNVNFDDLPPGLEDVVTGARQAMVDRMLTALYSYFDALLEWKKDAKPCGYSPGARSLCARSEQDCIRLQIGSLLPVLNSLGLWPKKTSENVIMSPAQLRAALHGIRLSDCNNNNLKDSKRESRRLGKQSAEPACGNFEEVLNRMKDVPLHHRQFANETQRNHMIAQQATTGLICSFVPHTTFKRVR